MKTSFLLRLALLTVGLTSGAFAQERKSYPPITFAVPGSNTTMTSKDRFVVLVIESAYLSHEGTAIPPDNVIDYLNTTMAANEAPYLAVHIREGITYGNVVKALDALSKTETKGISVSMKELPLGREPDDQAR